MRRMRPHSMGCALLVALGVCAAACGADGGAPDGGAPSPPDTDSSAPGQPDASTRDAAGDTAALPPDASSDDAADADDTPDAGPRADVLARMEKAADWQIAS